jgi:hypothetical protein
MTRIATLAVLAGSALGLAACAQTAARTSTVNPPHPGVVLVGSLLGAGEVPKGDPDGNGEFTGFFDVPGGMLCYDLGWGSIGAATAIHIHKGDPGMAGPPVIPIPVPTPAGTHAEGCVPAAKDVLTDIIAHPGSYYINVHDATYPGGAIRSQLQRP